MTKQRLDLRCHKSNLGICKVAAFMEGAPYFLQVGAKALTDELAAVLSLIWSVNPLTFSRSFSQFTARSKRPSSALVPYAMWSVGSLPLADSGLVCDFGQIEELFQDL